MAEIIRKELENGSCYYENEKAEMISCVYQDGEDFSEGYACVQLPNKKWTFINGRGKQLFGEHDFAWGFQDGFARVQNYITGSLFTSYLDKKGKEYTEIEFKKIQAKRAEILEK